MKNLKLLVAFVAGVALTLLVTRRGMPVFSLPHFTGFVDEGIGILGVIALILVGAYLSRKFFAQAEAQGTGQNPSASFFEFLTHLRRSKTDCWFGGVCGGFGRTTPIPAWVWRLCFAIAIFYYGTGLLAYLLLWVFLPEEDGVAATEQEAAPARHGAFFEFLHQLKRSSTDYWVGGVCGGLAKSTAAPAWVWRLIFTALVLCLGSGLVIYLLLWIFLPSDETKNQLAA